MNLIDWSRVARLILEEKKDGDALTAIVEYEDGTQVAVNQIKLSSLRSIFITINFNEPSTLPLEILKEE